MIVAGRFDGDANDALMWAQHGVYGACLGIIVRGVYEAFQNARAVLNEYGSDPLLGPLSELTFDHRALQPAHDHLAAYWRKKSGYAAPQLPIELIEDQISDWQEWLRQEVREWFFREPTAISSCRAVLTSQTISNDVANLIEAEFLHKLQLMYPIDQA